MTTELEDLAISIRQAIEQTYATGSTYMAIPFPWWESYLHMGYDIGFGDVPWGEICQEVVDGIDDSDVVLCLLPAGHRTDHGGPHMQVSEGG
jgi:hypothetical protein